MLSKPKMPTPYNTVVDVNNGVTFGCILTEGNIGRYEINVSNILGANVANIANEQGNGAYWTANNKITSSLTQGLSNFNEYKWSVRLFEQKGVVDTWCSYGTLQNDTKGGTPIISQEEDGKKVTLKISAHQNIIPEKVQSSENSGYIGTFPVYSVDYLVDGVNYYPNPIAYKSEDAVSTKRDYDLLYLPDTTGKVNINSSSAYKEIDFTDGYKSIGIIDNVVNHPTKVGYSIVTVYDFSGNIYQCVCKRAADFSLVYQSDGTKKSTKDSIYRYTLYKSEDGEICINGIYQTTYGKESGMECFGKYNSSKIYSNGNFEDGTALDTTNLAIISERDYKSTTTDTSIPHEIVRSYRLKIGGKSYKVDGYKMCKPGTSTDIDIYTYGEITISDSEKIDATNFKEGVSYTIYCNYIDSDEYYFKTHPNLFVSIYMNNSELNSEAINSVETIENTFYGYLSDINNTLYQNKIRSFQWSIYVKTINGVELIWKSGTKSSSQPTLTHKDFIQGQEYLVSLEITTDDNITYTSFQYPIIVNSFTPVNSNGEEIGLNSEADYVTVSFNYQKHCIDLKIKNGIKFCENIASVLNVAFSNFGTCTFDRLDIYKTVNGTIYNKVASIPSDLIIETPIRDYIINIEDYVIGGGNSYTYYLYPVFKYEYGNIAEKNTESSENTETIADISETVEYKTEYKALKPIVTDATNVPIYGINVVGLIPQTDEYNNIIENAYKIDYMNIWRFYLNTKNDTSTFNVSHAVHEGQKKYNKVSVGERGYITSGVSALLGDIQCSSNGRFDDGMETIDNWEEFVNNGEIKIICDQYGRIFPVDINECSYSYDENTPIRLCTFNFNYVQVADANEIEVLFNNDYIEFTDYKFLANNLNHVLSTNNENNDIRGMATLAT